MTNIEILNTDNMYYYPHKAYDIIFGDYIYENSNFEWVKKYFPYLKNGGLFIGMADYHTNHRFRVYIEDVCGATLVNDSVWKNEWGNHPKDRFHQCFDNIMIYSNVKRGWKFYPERVQVPKATANTKLNPSGRMTKTATAWIDDIALTTTSKERVKKKDGHLIRWQKPLRLYDRILLPFTNEGDDILDLFMGSGSLGKWSNQNNRNYLGIEKDKEVFELAKKNIDT